MIKQITTKRKSTPNKLKRLMAQGNWVQTKLPDGRIVPHFTMPTPELQMQLDEALESWVKKQLKADGYERICATRREHPFHSELLRERIDALLGGFGSAFKTDESADEARQQGYAEIEKLAALKAARGTSYDVTAARRDEDERVECGRRSYIRRWAKGFEDYRSMLRDPSYWRGTSRYFIVFPMNGPPLPDGPPPKPVFMDKRHPDRVVQLQDGWVNLYSKVAA
jgi:hypothetical protein